MGKQPKRIRPGQSFKTKVVWPNAGAIHDTFAAASKIFHLDGASLACKFGRFMFWNRVLSDEEHKAIMMRPDSTGIVPDKSGNGLDAKIVGSKWYHVRIARNKVKNRITYYLDGKCVSRRELELRGLLGGPIRITKEDAEILKKIGTVDMTFDMSPGDKIAYYGSSNQTETAK